MNSGKWVIRIGQAIIFLFALLWITRRRSRFLTGWILRSGSDVDHTGNGYGNAALRSHPCRGGNWSRNSQEALLLSIRWVAGCRRIDDHL